MRVSVLALPLLCILFGFFATLCYDVRMKNKLLALILGVFCLFSASLASFSVVLAAPPGSVDPPPNSNTLVPQESSLGLVQGDTLDCVRFMKISKIKESIPGVNKPTLKDAVVKGIDITVTGIAYDSDGKFLGDTYPETVHARESALTCGFKSGRIPLWLIPFYIVRTIDFLLVVGGLISVLFIIIGGYHMIIGSYSDEKETGKNTIKNAIIGLALCLGAYTIVNLAMLFLTS